ncbi:hypothetical protein H6G97_37250 [Nostoc flagelliforme FACHB-838]|uniref:Uncharacterized protein n=1 Tax=Nostoc flagelliforme FACHB-838 TaxID=2692904 RepID=A0ABR8DZD7_9NOSO|nr:hypothetical protein [Nostoc flagelliforme FACHB-838]
MDIVTKMGEEDGHRSALILPLGNFSLEPDSSQVLLPRCDRYYQNRYLAYRYKV